ncbi:MAG TPA: hypothetical protein VFE34_24825 [Dongiaceae bacterium]|nr:hypothetical protein [Dongiaceae bacterium]
MTSTVADIIARLQTKPAAAERPVISLVASAGTGKTETICRQILAGALQPSAPGRRPTVWFAVPNHRMVGELVNTLEELPGYSQDLLLVLEGRNQPEMCRRAALIKRAGGQEWAIQNTFCDDGERRCPHFAECKYQAMRRQARGAEGRIVLMTHSSLLQHPQLPNPDLVVIDEAIWSTIVKKLDFSLETFDRVARAISTAQDLDARMQQGAVRHLESVRLALTASDGQMLQILRERKLEAGQLDWLAGIVAGGEDRGCGLTPDLPDEELEKRLRDRLAPAHRQVAAAIRQLAVEIERERPVPIAAEALQAKYGSETVTNLRSWGRAQIANVRKPHK